MLIFISDFLYCEMCKKQGLRADLSRATYLGSYFNLPPLRMSSPAPQIKTDEGFSMRDVALRKMPRGVHEKNVRHVLEYAVPSTY